MLSGHVHFERLASRRDGLTDVTAHPRRDDVLAFNVGHEGGVEGGDVAAAGAGPPLLSLQSNHHRAN